MPAEVKQVSLPVFLSCHIFSDQASPTQQYFLAGLCLCFVSYVNSRRVQDVVSVSFSGTTRTHVYKQSVRMRGPGARVHFGHMCLFVE